MLAVAAVLAALAALPATAAAGTCDGDFQFDPEGYLWDFTDTYPIDPNTRETSATFDDGGSNGPAGTPPGPRLDGDSYDAWGALFVGGDALANAYTVRAPGTCFDEDAGRERVFPSLTIDGLEVQRKVYVSPTGMPGARILNVVHNPGTAPRTTSIQVGDTQSDSSYGDLGSDDKTRVRSSSDGDDALTRHDVWAVTSDHDNGTTNQDLALAHVFDGAGGADRIDFATLTGTNVDDARPEDNLAYRWEGVTIPAGGTAAYVSYEVQRGVPDANAAADDQAATDAALAYAANPLAHVYAAMTDAEIAAVRNWPRPKPTAAITAPALAGDQEDVAFSAAGSTASTVSGICTGLSYAWSFGDGATATGVSASHRFGAGTHTVTLTVTNSCGEAATSSQTLAVTGSTAPEATDITAPTDTTAPVIGRVTLTPARFAVSRRSTARTAARGTTIRYRLSEPAAVTLRFQRAVTGRRVGRSCRRVTARNRRGRPCRRYVAAGTLHRAGRPGANRVAFSGRIGRRALRRGTHRLVVTAIDSAGNRSTSRPRRFRIVR